MVLYIRFFQYLKFKRRYTRLNMQLKVLELVAYITLRVTIKQALEGLIKHVLSVLTMHRASSET